MKLGDYWKDDDYIFCNKKGEPLNDIREGFNNLLVLAGMGLDVNDMKFTPYCCRHYFITAGLRRGIDEFAVSKNCGTSIDMIKTYYDATITEDHIDTIIKGLPSYLQNTPTRS